MFRVVCLVAFGALLSCIGGVRAGDVAGPRWDARKAGDAVLAGLVPVTAPEVKGAHDADFVIAGGKAFIVYEANDQKGGEDPRWPFIYAGLSVVDLATMKVEKAIPFARSGQKFANETLPEGACFVPRIVAKDPRTLRCFFASEAPGKRQSQMWFIDFDTETMTFNDRIVRARLKTSAGVFDMQPRHFHADAVAHGFRRPAVDYGLYILDSFKTIGDKIYVTLNNYPGGQNALATINDALDTFEVVGHFNDPATMKLTEAAAHRLPGGDWLAILRQEAGDRNYVFSTSPDGRRWTVAAPRKWIPNGTSSKPTLDRLLGVYHLGWQESPPKGRPGRSIFNVDVSEDGQTWRRKYRFDTDKSFQYPVFRESNGKVYVAVTQGDTDPSRKERILFGLLADSLMDASKD